MCIRDSFCIEHGVIPPAYDRKKINLILTKYTTVGKKMCIRDRQYTSLDIIKLFYLRNNHIGCIKPELEDLARGFLSLIHI